MLKYEYWVYWKWAFCDKTLFFLAVKSEGGKKKMKKGLNLKINYNRTRRAVERFIEDYNYLKFRLEESDIPCITQRWNLEMPVQKGNRASDLIEKHVIKNIENEQKISEMTELIVMAFNRLSEPERKYLGLKFFTEKYDISSDEDIMYKMAMGYRVYTNTKRSAYKKFAIALRLEVYEK